MPPALRAVQDALVVSAALLLLAAGGAAGGRSAAERPLAVVVATGVGATSALVPNAGWHVELPWLLPGDVDPAVSPDGRRIAFVSDRDGNEELYVADTRSGEVRRLTRSPRAADRSPTWSPNGLRLAWDSGPPGAADLFIMRANGAAKQRLVGGAGDDVEPAWSPDGARIAFSSTRGGRRQLWAVATAGGEPERLTLLPGRARTPAWAPGGARVVFVRETAGDSDLWLLELADGSTRALTRGGARDSRPDWSPRGEGIAFGRSSAGRTSLWVVGVDGAAARPLPDTDGLTDPDWARTDRALVPRPDELLPDLDQRAPADVRVVQTGLRFNLGFASTTENRGQGPLVIQGVRRGEPTMRAHQVVEHRGGTSHVVRDVGRLRYERHAPHFHWHLKSFVTYTLHRARDFEAVVRDGKSGFCLIDRWGAVLPRIPGSGPPRFVGDCKTGQPDAQTVTQGTSVGYIDRYPSFFHGQELDVTRLPAGRYVLVHRANPTRTMRELAYSNDAASVLLDLRWPNGRGSAPRVIVLRRCEASERCPPGSAGP